MRLGPHRIFEFWDNLGVSSPTHEPFRSHLTPFEGVEFGSHVEVEVQTVGLPVGILLALVEVDDVLHGLAAATLDDPVVPVKGLGVAHQRLHPGFGREGTGAQPAKGLQFGPAAGLGRVRLPCLDERPGPLVDGVVDGDDVGDAREEVFGVGGRQGLLAHDGMEEL